MAHLGLGVTLICVLALHQVAGFPKFNNADDPLPGKINPYDYHSKQYPRGEGELDWRSNHVENEVLKPNSYSPEIRGHSGDFNKNKRGAVQSKGKCQQVCAGCTLDKPVCGKAIKDGSLENFPSKCSMDCYACSHEKKYILLRHGACPPQVATSPRPSSLRTFPTALFITTHRPTPKSPCNCKCPTVKVICAQDKYGNQQTFMSECRLSCHNCTSNEDFRKIKDGDC